MTERVIRVAAAWTSDSRGRILLVRKRGSAIFMQPGGKTETGETPPQTLVRELAEELGVAVDPVELDAFGRFRADGANEPGHVLVADVFGLRLDAAATAAAEIEEARWFTPAEADALGDRLAPLARRMLAVAACRGRTVSFEFDGPITTARLVLRPFVADDADDVLAYQSREDVCRYLLFDPMTRIEVVERVANYAGRLRLAAEGDWANLAVELASTVIGQLDICLRSAAHRAVEIGWMFHPQYQGQGYASEAVTELLRLAFESLRVRRVVAELDSRNERSQALCERVGMRREAHRIGDFWQRGEWTDTLQYAMLADEWFALGR